ncbi:extracellular solute-binding protein [Martelella sp. AD-3]|uniref:ABC transporter substrate-binding protein n=1 Tax=Martelella sp. AD-3 TaxID=686597 RepID=UPI00046410D6|nr:extracellular solute-binding protein [Martelella sp. AD-3]AMM84043.1 hypothetical protein AZF01_06445 [Martelella sp. AD-3]
MKAILAAAGVAALATSASAETIRVFANSAHQIAFEGQGGQADASLADAFERETGIKVVWETVPYPEMRQTMLRALAGRSAQYDVVMVENSWAVPSVLDKLVSVNSVASPDQTDELADIFPAMKGDFTQNGELKGVPIRSNPQIVHFNKKIFSERGIDVPISFEAMLDAAEKASYKRSDGASIYGLAIKPNEDLISIVKALGGGIVSPNYEVLVDTPETIAAIKRIRTLFDDGAIPPNFFSMDSASVQTLMREGLAAMTLFGDNYYLRFNDPNSSRIAGDAGFFAVPGEKDGSYAPTKVAFWSAALPANADAESHANGWKFIHYLASPPVQLQMALNGNGPVSITTLHDPAFIDAAPYAAVSEIALDHASPLLPVFDGTAQIQDTFEQAAVAAILGKETVEVAMSEVAAKIEKIIASKRPE